MTRSFNSFALIFLSAALAPSALAQNFTVTASHGAAEIGKDSHSYQAAAVNSTHEIPAWGKTGSDSWLTINFNANNSFRLLADSEAQVLGENSGSAWHRVISLKIGEAKISHDTGAAPTVRLDCETPTAVCGAVGTEFDVNATKGEYSVSKGQISLSSDKDDLSASISGGSIVYNPGQENTYSHGSFTGGVRLGGKTYHASDATFTVAKGAGSSSEIAVHISSGKLGVYGPGNYVTDGDSLKAVDSKSASIHADYLAAAKIEGALNVKNAAYHAAHRSGGVSDSAVADAAKEATELRHKLFTRGTIREINKKINEAVIDNATRSAIDASTRAARPGH